MGRNNQRRKTENEEVGGGSSDLSNPKEMMIRKHLPPFRILRANLWISLYINRLIQKHIEDLNDITGLEIGLG